MTNDTAEFGHYMIGVFDVLGQSRKLREQTGVPLTARGRRLFAEPACSGSLAMSD